MTPWCYSTARLSACKEQGTFKYYYSPSLNTHRQDANYSSFSAFNEKLDREVVTHQNTRFWCSTLELHSELSQQTSSTQSFVFLWRSCSIFALFALILAPFAPILCSPPSTESHQFPSRSGTNLGPIEQSLLPPTLPNSSQKEIFFQSGNNNLLPATNADSYFIQIL